MHVTAPERGEEADILGKEEEYYICKTAGSQLWTERKERKVTKN